MKYLVLFVGIIIAIFQVNGQSKEANDNSKIEVKYGLLAKPSPDSIVLRFAPIQYYMLQPHSLAGVWLERLIVRDGKVNGKWERINSSPIKPWQEYQFNNDYCKKNEYAMTVAMLLYGNLKSGEAQDFSGNLKQKSDMLNSLYSMATLGCDLSVLAANSFGARWVDHYKIKENEKVFYRIYNAIDYPLFQVDTSLTFVTYDEWNIKQSPRFLSAESGERYVELSFDFNKNLERWSAFNIERSADNGKTFTRVNKKPYLVIDTARISKIYYQDSVVNYIKYIYRVQGIDPFAETSAYSNEVIGMGRDKTPPGSITLINNEQETKGIKLSWHFNENFGNSDLLNFTIRKGPGINNMNTIVAKVSAKTFEYYDPSPAVKHSVYYEIMATDTAGNVTFSNPVRYFIADTDPPKPPDGVVAKIDSNGIVSLHWELDTLDEILGYRVYRTNDIKHEMVCLQEGYLSSNSFFDTLSTKTLTREVYYTVVAVDYSYNHSQRSKVIRLIKPDAVPPIAPQFIDYNVRASGVFLKWDLSPSADVEEYQLIRNLVSDSTQIFKTNLSKYTDHYIDTSLFEQKFYQYKLFAMDSSGNKSAASFPVLIRTYSRNVEADINLRWIDPSSKIGFTWQKPNEIPIFYIIYRDAGNGFQQIANAKSEDTRFMLPPSILNQYSKPSYGLQAVYSNQLKSKIYIIN